MALTRRRFFCPTHRGHHGLHGRHVGPAEPTIAFVAGATGYVGRVVVERLLDAGVESYAHVRPQSSRLDYWREHFGGLGATVDSTPWTDGELRARLAEISPTLVFALIGTTRKRAKSEAIAGDPYGEIDYGLTAMVHRAAAKLDGARFIYLSAAGVGPKSSSAYMSARWRAEELIRGGPLPYTIARPSIITGPDRDDGRAGERIAGAIADGALALAGLFGGRKLRARYRSTTNEVLAAALVRLALSPEAANTVVEGDDLR